METTLIRCKTRESHLAGNHPGYPDDTAIFVTRFAPRGRDPAAADENLYRYCDNMPTMATDPSGESETILDMQDPKDGSSNNGSVHLTTSEPFKAGQDGNFRWGIKWTLSDDSQINGGDGAQAYVLQEITLRVLVRKSGEDITLKQAPGWFKEHEHLEELAHELTFWEAWQFVPKGTWPGGKELPVYKNQPGMNPVISSAQDNNDVYSNETFGGEGTCGYYLINGHYGLVQGVVPATFKIGSLGGVEPSGAAWSTWTDPKIGIPWKDVKGHSLTVHWGGDWNEITSQS